MTDLTHAEMNAICHDGMECPDDCAACYFARKWKEAEAALDAERARTEAVKQERDDWAETALRRAGINKDLREQLDAERTRADSATEAAEQQFADVRVAINRAEAAEARNRKLEVVVEAAREYFTAFEARARRPFPGTALAVSEAHDKLCAALAVLEEPQ